MSNPTTKETMQEGFGAESIAALEAGDYTTFDKLNQFRWGSMYTQEEFTKLKETYENAPHFKISVDF